jgi:hypothetical protein
VDIALMVGLTVLVAFAVVAAAGYAIDSSVPDEPDEIPVARVGP